MISRLLHRLNSAPRPLQPLGPTTATSKERQAHLPSPSRCPRRAESAAVECSSISDTLLHHLEVRPLSLG